MDGKDLNMIMNKNFSKLKNIFGQGMVEYMLLFAVVIIVILVAINPNGILTSSVDKVLDDAAQEIEDMAICINYCGDAVCPPVDGNGCCEPGEEDSSNPNYSPADCGVCVPSCKVGQCGSNVSDGCGGTINCPPCPCGRFTEPTACGIVTLPATSHGSSATESCPFGCSGNVRGNCNNGSWSIADSCS